jgi:hypothetical protein
MRWSESRGRGIAHVVLLIPRRALLLTAILLFCDTAAYARTTELRGGKSPDGRLTVLVSENSRKRINYEIVALPSHSVLRKFPSTYQPFADESPDWSWHEATGAEVCWKADGHYLAIDEDTYHHAGHVLLAEIKGRSVRSIPLPERAIIAATGQKWDRYRIRIQEGWVWRRELSLHLAGYAVQTYLPDGRHTFVNRSFEVQLRVRKGHAMVIDCREITKN